MFNSSVCVSLVYLQNTAAESDEEEDLSQLQAIEQKLLAYDPAFTHQHTHASITTQKSALISACRPQYEEGDVEGKLVLSCCCFRLSTVHRPHADSSKYGAMAGVRDLVLPWHGRC
jgi:hypothetical protein